METLNELKQEAFKDCVTTAFKQIKKIYKQIKVYVIKFDKKNDILQLGTYYPGFKSFSDIYSKEVDKSLIGELKILCEEIFYNLYSNRPRKNILYVKYDSSNNDTYII